MATHTAMAQGSDATIRRSLEQRVGIIHYVSQKEHGWYGQFRTRFTDFQVHEISINGEVIHLHDFQTNARQLPKTEVSRQPAAAPQVVCIPVDPKQPKDGAESTTISPSDRTILVDLFGETTTEGLIDLCSKAAKDKKSQPKASVAVEIAAISDKAQRSRIHSEIRRVFCGKIDTITNGDGSIKATLAGRGGQQWGNRSRNERSRYSGQNAGQTQDGKFLHFTLYKENRDTMEAINQIARVLNLKPSFFGTAGTKDRRAVTTQRVSMRRRNPQSLLPINHKINGVRIGDFTFEDYQIHLGQNKGNEFVIVAKNCYFSGTEGLSFEQKLDIAKATVGSALEQVNHNGFINYYGTQRFGTHEIGTQEVGTKILRQDFEGAVRALLSFDPKLLDASERSSTASKRQEDAARARACSIFSDTGYAQEALKYLPRRCHVESTLMRHLSRQPRDFLGALLSINRGMRSMYVHAYQSLVWNFAASKRWELFGPKVVKGDLVLIRSDISSSQENCQNTDGNEETIHLVDEASITEETGGLRAHALTEEEANSGKYSIFDIVLPSPGWDVVYPDNVLAQFYKEFMAKEENGGLDPHDMLRRQKDFSLPGSYRKLMGKFISTASACVQTYSNDTDQLVPTDLDLIRSRKAKEAAEQAAARRDTRAAPSAWQTFADNVEELDLEEARARAERRKTEESSDLPEGRARDTWVRTTVNESNKRVKVAVQTDDVRPGKAEESSNLPEVRARDTWVRTTVNENNKRVKVAVQTDDVRPGSERSVSQTRTDEMQVDEDMAFQSGTNGGTQPMDYDGTNSDPSVATTLTSQVRAVAENPIQLSMAALRISTEDHIKTDGDAVPPEVQPGGEASMVAVKGTSSDGRQNVAELPVKDEQVLNPGKPEPDTNSKVGERTTNKPEGSGDVATNGEPTDRSRGAPFSTSTDEKKIAVILRFALNTSQYATIALRELEGMVSASDKIAGPASSPVP
ncbi:pseudouridine synthase [Hypoxylon sp. FL0543]|nr:pseudouridine synthase [Hypoxylon sp. FL0543]